MNSAETKLLFPESFDEYVADEAEVRGYFGSVQVELPDGCRYPVVFFDPIRLQQDLKEEVAHGVPFIAEPGMIVVPDVTLDNMEKAVAKLYREGFFSSLRPIQP